MAEVVGVRFKDVGKVYYFDPDGKQWKKDDHVIVETARGVECGEIAMENREVPEDKVIRPLKSIIRAANEEDIRMTTANRKREEDAFRFCEKKAKSLGLDMNMVDVECTFDGSRMLFYYTSENRVDFRELVKCLAGTYRTRIEMRQIGVRDKAKKVGGFGICGKPFCCSEFLGDFAPVSIKMAKEQGLSLNPTKISGACSRLMCCLRYEQESYEHLLRVTPRVGASVDTPDGRGTVVDSNLLTGLLKVNLERRPDAPVSVYDRRDCKLLRENRPHPGRPDARKKDAPADTK